jgi:D-glycero-alpha-D-manno-heptose-7-phosphate kinase
MARGAAGARRAVIAHGRAPLRIDLAGGWTDVAPYSARAGGVVVNVAVNLYAHAQVRRRRGGVSVRALDLGAAATARHRAELRPDGELALLKAAARRLGPSGGFEVLTSSDAPPGSGLGGSGAMGVALVAAFAALADERPIAAEIAQRAYELETGDAGLVGGKQDQYAASLGGVQFLEFGGPGVRATRLTPPAARLRELERHLVLCYTGASRLSADTHERVWRRFEQGDTAVIAALDGLRACALRMRDAVAGGDVAAVGEVLSRNWAHQRALGEGMQTETMRALERAANTAGAAGCKACGAGAGGCMVFLAKAGRAFALADALRTAGGTVLRFAFDDAGVTSWSAPEH